MEFCGLEIAQFILLVSLVIIKKMFIRKERFTSCIYFVYIVVCIHGNAKDERNFTATVSGEWTEANSSESGSSYTESWLQISGTSTEELNKEDVVSTMPPAAGRTPSSKLLTRKSFFALLRILRAQAEIKSQADVIEKTLQEIESQSVKIPDEIRSMQERLVEMAENLKNLRVDIRSDLEVSFQQFKTQVLRAIITSQTPIKCPWLSQRFGAECFSYHTGWRTWLEWRTFCKGKGGELASFDYPELPLELLLRVMPNFKRDLEENVGVGYYGKVFIGADNGSPSGQWHWLTDGTIFLNDSRWYPDEPDIFISSEKRCLSLRVFRKELQVFQVGFDDIDCDLGTTAICEHPPEM